MIKTFLVFITTVAAACALEKPTYQTLLKADNFEIRKYATIPIVSAPMENMQKRDDSFRSLFGYISGDNQKKQKISMTAPVFMNNGDAGEKAGTMSFVIPTEVAKKGAPVPAGKAVKVTKIEGGMFAVLKFKGWTDPGNRRQASADLLKRATAAGYKPVGKSFFATYNPPWIPELFRRNEVWQRISK